MDGLDADGPASRRASTQSIFPSGDTISNAITGLVHRSDVTSYGGYDATGPLIHGLDFGSTSSSPKRISAALSLGKRWWKGRSTSRTSLSWRSTATPSPTTSSLST